MEIARKPSSPGITSLPDLLKAESRDNLSVELEPDSSLIIDTHSLLTTSLFAVAQF